MMVHKNSVQALLFSKSITQVPKHTQKPTCGLSNACSPLWLALIDDGRGEANHMGGPIPSTKDANQLC